MADREKVMNGLQCKLTAHYDTCKDCPYFSEELAEDYPEFEYFCNRSQIEADALELLKAQKPRVMTLEEVLAHDYKDGPLWLETIDNVITCGFAYCYKYYVQFSIPVMENEYLLKRDTWNRTDTYNKIWRCWTSRPTDEQREAVKWE